MAGVYRICEAAFAFTEFGKGENLPRASLMRGGYKSSGRQTAAQGDG